MGTCLLYNGVGGVHVTRRIVLGIALSLPSAALAIDPEPGGPYQVDAEGTVTLDASDTEEALGCWASQRLPPSDPPAYGVEFRLDVNDDGVFDVGWHAPATVEYSAAGIDGPQTISVPLETRCWYFDVTSWVPFTGTWLPDVAGVDAVVEVHNVPPIVGDVSVDFADPQALPAGSRRSFSVVASDPEPADTLSYRWLWSDGRETTGNPSSREVPQGALSVEVFVTDDDGAEVSTTADFTGANAAPQIVSLDIPATVGEGDDIDVSVEVSDDDPVTVTWIFPDGTEVEGTEASWTPPTEGTYEVQVEITDGTSTVRSERSVDVVNRAPVFDGSPTVPAHADEGESAALAVPAMDPGADPLTWTWDFGDGSDPVDTTTGFVRHIFGDQGSYTVEVTVGDGEGGSVETSFTVDVLNLDPQIVQFNVPSQTQEGDLTPVDARASDVPADTLTYSWDFGDGSVATGSDASHIWSAGTYTVRLEVTDGDGGLAVASREIAVSNTAPQVEELDLPTDPVEGVEATFDVTVVDAGTDTITITWHFGDGGTATGATATHTYADDGTFDGSVVVEDAGGASTPFAFNVTVANVDPVLTDLVMPSTVDEGSLAHFEADATDVATDTVSFEWLVDGVSEGTGLTFERMFPDDSQHLIEVVASDEDGGAARADTLLRVLNVPPTVVLTGDTDDGDEPVLAFSAVVTDPGAEFFTYTWQYGDGTEEISSFPQSSHVYASNGTYVVRVIVTDGDGGSATGTLVSVIDSIGPRVSNLGGFFTPPEGTIITATCSAVDEGASGGLDFSWDFGDGQTGTGQSVQHAWADDGTYDLVCTATDLEGRSASRSASVLVTNVAPQLSGTPATTIIEGDTYFFTPTATDAGVDDELTFSLVGPTGAVIDDAGAVRWTTPLRSVGSYDLTLEVDDGDGGTNSLSWSVQVQIRDDDGDGLSDVWETDNGLDPTDPADAGADTDGDGRTSLDEYQGETDPNVDDRPQRPELLSPAGGARVSSQRPLLLTGPAAADAETALTFDLSVYEDAALTQLVTTVQGVQMSGPGASWRVDTDLVENQSYWWTARAFDGFGASQWAVPATFLVDGIPEAPGRPALIWPLDGSTVPSDQPTLRFSTVSDPEGGPVTYTLTIDEVGGSRTVIDDLSSAGAEVTWTLVDPLPDLTSVCWRAIAEDETGLQGPASGSWCFTIDLGNRAPSEPEIVRPLDGALIDTDRTVVQVRNGVDPEGRETVHRFQASTDPTFATDVLSADVDGDPSGRTSWLVTQLREDTWYYVRVLASDGAADSAWVQTSFFVNQDNAAPPAPTLLNPSDGEAWSPGHVLEVANTVDPEGFAVTYDFQIRSSGGDVLVEKTGVAEGEVTTAWTPDHLPPGLHDWTARGVDSQGLAGPWAAVWRLEVMAADDLPNSREVPEPTGVGLPPAELLGCDCDTGRGGAGMGWLVLALVAGRRRRSR